MTMQTAVEHQPFSIVFVCTGNICRSALAQLMLQSRFDAFGFGVTITSAGTSALVGESLTTEGAAIAARYGVGETAIASYTATQLTESIVTAADLVLTATHEHSHAVARLSPRSARSTFTITQFARFVHYLSTEENTNFVRAKADVAAPSLLLRERLRTLTDDAVFSRGFVPPPADALVDDIEDPYRKPMEIYDRVGATLDLALHSIAHYFAAAAEPPVEPSSAFGRKS